MKKLCLILLAVLLLGASSTGFAAQPRWQALGGEHRFLLDTSNYEVYQGRMLEFADICWVIPADPDSVGPRNMSSGLVVEVADDLALGMHYNLAGAHDNLRAALQAIPFATSANLRALTLTGFPDLSLAKRLADMTVGGRLVLGLASREDPAGDKTASATSIDAGIGVTKPLAMGDLDLGVRVTMSSFSDEIAAPKVESTGGIGVAFDARLMKPKADMKTRVFVLSAATGSEPTVKGVDKASYMRGDIGLGCTKAYGRKSLLVHGAVIGLDRETTSAAGVKEATTTTITATYLGGFEKAITKWLTGRAGASATLTRLSGDDDTVAYTMDSALDYDFGFRISYKGAIVDAVLCRDFLHRGPNVISGALPANLSTNVYLAYEF